MFLCVFVTANAKEMRLKRDNAADPVKFLLNIAVHLSGPSRTPGDVIVGAMESVSSLPSQSLDFCRLWEGLM